MQTHQTTIPFEVRSTRGVMTFGEVYAAVQGTVWMNAQWQLGSGNVLETFADLQDYRDETGLLIIKKKGLSDEDPRWPEPDEYTNEVPTLEEATGAPAPNTVSGLDRSHPHLGRLDLTVAHRLRAALFRWQRSSASRPRGQRWRRS